MVMRKITRILLAAIMAVSFISVTAMAATESPERGHDGVDSVTTSDGSDVTPFIIVTYAGDTSGYDTIDSELATSQAQVSGVTDFSTLPGITTEALQAALDAQGEGYSAADLRVVSLLDVSYINSNGEVENLSGVDITLSEQFEDGVAVVVLYKPDGNTWQIANAVMVNGRPVINGVETRTPFLVLSASRKRDASPTPTATATPTTPVVAAAAASTGTTSPQTGEYAGVYVLVAAAALTVAGVVCVKRAKATK
uniref:LPXTG cell wall anchor domain-containing protein n=1 Tax=uncultured bacterium Contig783 TaxID=1393612 RepID=W0FML2_9BACT|nr:hypothetical protein [uncultured bacterium Contig783]